MPRLRQKTPRHRRRGGRWSKTQSYSLVGSPTRNTSQRMLLRLLTLQTDNSTAANTLLEDSPHNATLMCILALTASPALVEVTDISFPFCNPEYQSPHLLGTELMASLDGTLASHPAIPRMHYRRSLPRADGMALNDFFDALERGMSMMHA
ncbi:hypothetical protein FB451DRAFT_1403975 [Mycena latifolia]|nr:hypothetical protein FB451DRAFT_1403975 [Mycena latifolia]